jgi:hypothetical protein
MRHECKYRQQEEEASSLIDSLCVGVWTQGQAGMTSFHRRKGL